MDKHKQLLHAWLKREDLKNISNVDFIENMGVTDIVNQFRLKSLLDSYGDVKWWLSENQEVRGYGQLQEETLLVDFEDAHAGVSSIMGKEVSCSGMALCRAELLEAAYNKMAYKLNESLLGNNTIVVDGPEK